LPGPNKRFSLELHWTIRATTRATNRRFHVQLIFSFIKTEIFFAPLPKPIWTGIIYENLAVLVIPDGIAAAYGLR
jgi:hypothetical protein